MTRKSIFFTIIAVALLAALPAAADRSDADVAKQVEATLAKMTLDEKFTLLGEGSDGFSIAPIKRLGLPQVRMTDASIGVRNYGPSTQYAATALGAATWNRDLMHQVGTQLAADCRARGVQVVLGPGLNIMRAPLCGRNFEYMSEDPYLTAQMGVSLIQGLQQHGVGAVAKHFALNNMEWGRNTVDSRCDLRTMHEIYLPAFRAAVQQGGVDMIMDSYNLVNGVHATENPYLNKMVLRHMWGFDGVVMSDWGGTHSTVRAFNGGLDLDMDGGKVARYFNPDSLHAALNAGKIKLKDVDDKVRHILTVIYRFNWDRLYKLDSGKYPLDNQQSRTVAQREAEEGIVLLKNQDNLLPLSGVKSMALVGPFIDANVRGGGSSAVTPISFTSLRGGIARVMPSVRVHSVAEQDVRPFTTFYQARGGRNPGLKAEYFNNMSMGGQPLFTETVKSVNFNWGGGSPSIDVLGTDHFSVRYTGYLRVPKSGDYQLALSSDDGSRLYIDDVPIIDNWGNHSTKEVTKTMTLKAGRDYAVRIDYSEDGGDAAVTFGYRTSDAADVATQVKQCAVAVVTVGFGQSAEYEGFDRPWQLPDDQLSLIKTVAAANPNTVVVIYSGAAVDVSSFADKVKTIIWAGYPGQEGGTALARILNGEVNPSGRLAATWPKRWEDCPAHSNFYGKQGGHLDYAEGLLVGYRWADKKGVEPQYPFGYGLSYTTFRYSNLKVKRSKDRCTATVTVTNTGRRSGSEVVQAYVAPAETAADEPVMTLRGFEKVTLKPGQSKSVTLTLDPDAFSTYKVEKQAFTVNPGTYRILIGHSSRDLRLSATLKVK